MSQPKVTILLPVYNGQESLARAISSIINQTYPDWKLLILEDGSTDATSSIAQSFKDTRIKIISDGLHLGIVTRLNQGIQLTDTPYIARMDADDVSYPERLKNQISFLEVNPTIDLVGTAICVVNKEGKQVRQHIFPTSHHQIVSQPWLKTISVAHPTWCGHKDWFQHWKYRDYIRNEDQELLLRAHNESSYANLPDILLDYFETPSFSKKLTARWGWITVLWSFYGTKGRLFPFLGGILISTAKLLRDFLKKT
ncbi:glycosyltransferase [Runella sp.]|jgi:glycosyltransferase involved in cell wall biosynthesis|uniref:glycosyltransferase n=1 Tax=Runella sp. TaxID=1960881 RepID=UPI00260C6F0E|nr:glycosyltransferase [Runella sp.]